MAATREIERIRLTDADALSDRLEFVDAPCVIEGGVIGWRAVRYWTPLYLKQKLGDVPVRYKISSSNVHPDFRAREIARMFALGSSSFGAFLDTISSGPAEERARFLFTGDEQFLLRRRDGITSIDPTLGPLLDDVEVPSLIPSAQLYSVWAWFSGAGVRTWLHYDNNGCHNLNAQVTGQKQCWLWSPNEVAALDPFPFGGPNPAHNCSQIDVDQPDLARFPEFANVPRWEGRLNPGDLLFIPAWWWHAFLHLGAFNSNVNFWWKPRERPVNPVAERQALLDIAGNANTESETAAAARERLRALDQGR